MNEYEAAEREFWARVFAIKLNERYEEYVKREREKRQ